MSNLMSIDELSEEVGCYASSQGMFGGNTPPNSIGGYVVNEEKKREPEEYDDLIESAESNDSDKPEAFVFIRLYQSYYSSKTNPAWIIDKAIRVVEKKDPTTGHIYNHAAISPRLEDAFLGLSTGVNAELHEYNLKTECLVTPSNSYIKGCDPEKSEFTVYAVPVTNEEYSRIQSFLQAERSNKGLTWVPTDIIPAAIKKISEKVSNKNGDFNDKSKEDAPAAGEPQNGKHTINIDEKMVCSGFCAHVLVSCTKYRNYFAKHGIDWHKLSPNDLVNKLDFVKYCFHGAFKDYDNAAKEFVSKHEMFKKYYKG